MSSEQNEINEIIDIKEILDDINLNLLNIHTRLLSIETTLNYINTSTHNMDQHISFVENVFDVVKKPFVNVLKWYNKDLDKIDKINLDKLIKDKQM